MRNTTKEEKDEIIKRYYNGERLNDIIQDLNISRSTIYYILKKRGLKKRDPYLNREYSLNNHYFDSLDSHEKAHILGFIYADGGLTKDRLKIKIQLGDLVYLNYIKNAINYGGPIRIAKGVKTNVCESWDSCSLEVCDKVFCSGLRGAGIIENKSSTKQFPENLNLKFLNSFVLGYFNGNGCLDKLSQSYNKSVFIYVLSICSGSKDFLIKMKDLIEKQIPVKFSWFDYKTFFYIKLASRSYVKIFLEWMFTDKTFGMTRKDNIVSDFLNNYTFSPFLKIKQINPITGKIVKIWKSMTDIAENFLGHKNKSKTVAKCIKRKKLIDGFLFEKIFE